MGSGNWVMTELNCPDGIDVIRDAQILDQEG